MGAIQRIPEPADGDERAILLGWLAFHRNALEAKCAGLDAEQLATRSAPPSPLSLLGLVRHLTEMERVYAVWALGPKSDLAFVWGEYTDDGPEWDFDADASKVDESMATWEREKRAADERTGNIPASTRSGRATVTACGGTCRSSSVSTHATTATPISFGNGSMDRPVGEPKRRLPNGMISAHTISAWQPSTVPTARGLPTTRPARVTR